MVYGTGNPTGEWQRFDVEVEAANSFFKMYTMDVNGDSRLDIVAGGRQGAVIYITRGNQPRQRLSGRKQASPKKRGALSILMTWMGMAHWMLLTHSFMAMFPGLPLVMKMEKWYLTGL